MVDSQELYRALLRSLTLPVTESEKRAILLALLQERLGLGPTAIQAGVPSHRTADSFLNDIKRLNTGEPVQYVVGKAPFLGRWFNVTPSVLIPRPETEWLAELVITRLGRSSGGKILDIGTGSGCLAITLALELPGSTISATDSEESALSVAEGNAHDLNAAVRFYKNDVLTEELPMRSLDAVVSNPPYIRSSERAGLSSNVIGFEPEKALFVPDSDPLVFHRTIAQKARRNLNPGGLLAMEINEHLGPATADTVTQVGFREVTLHQDLDGRDRFVTAINPG